MTSLFFKILEMSITGSIVILVTILAGFLLRKRSKKFIMILWAVAAFRLLVPVDIQSAISIYNYLPLSSREIVTGVQYKNATVPDYHLAERDYSTTVDLSAQLIEQDSSVQTAKTVVSSVWIAGTASVGVYYLIRYFMLKRNLRGAKRIGIGIYESDKVSSPFVFGLLMPKIYLPEVLDNNERECVLKHETAHIENRDLLYKFIGMVILAVHWYNPVVWLGYAFFEQDLEMRCDESAIEYMDAEHKKIYAMSIVNFARKNERRSYLVTPLQFSRKTVTKVALTSRVKNIISHKYGTLSTTVSITLAVLLVAGAFGFNARDTILKDLDFYSEDTGIKAVLADDYIPADDQVIMVCREAAQDSALYLDGLFYREFEDDDACMNSVVCFEICDIRQITDDPSDYTEDDYLRYYIRHEIGFDRYYVISTEDVNVSGSDYTKYTISCLDRHGYGRTDIIYIGRIDEYRFSDIYIDTHAYTVYENYDSWFVE